MFSICFYDISKDCLNILRLAVLNFNYWFLIANFYQKIRARLFKITSQNGVRDLDFQDLFWIFGIYFGFLGFILDFLDSWDSFSIFRIF